MQTMATTVVVVDDERDVRDFICSVLEDEGYDVICLRHPGEVAHLKEREPQPHVFVLDIMLPSISGIELARQLRTDGFTETPMIALSASLTMLHIDTAGELLRPQAAAFMSVTNGERRV